MNVNTFLQRFVDKETPCVFRGILPAETSNSKPHNIGIGRKGEREFEFLNNSQTCGNACTVDAFFRLFNEEQRTCHVYGCLGTQPSGSPLKHIQCTHTFLSQLVSHDHVRFQPDVRFWTHKSGHYTRAHYDANLVHILNFCLKGSKTFFLAPPGSRLTWPLTNICVNGQLTGSDVTAVTIHPGDAVYLPSRWLHAVQTTEDAVNADLRFYPVPLPEPVLATREFALVELNRYWSTPFLRSCEYIPVVATQTNQPAALAIFVREFGLPLLLIGLLPFVLLLRGLRGPTAVLAIMTILGFWYVHVNSTLHGGLLNIHANTILMVFCSGIALALLVQYQQGTLEAR